MARLHVDRSAINEEAWDKLALLIKNRIESDCFIRSGTILNSLILEAGFLTDYRQYGSDIASIKGAIRRGLEMADLNKIYTDILMELLKRGKKK